MSCQKEVTERTSRELYTTIKSMSLPIQGSQ